MKGGVVGALFFLCFVIAIFALTAPWLGEVAWVANGTTQPTFTVGLLLMDSGSSNGNSTSFGLHLNWCDSVQSTLGSSSTCSSIETSLLAMSIIFGIGAIFLLLTGILLFFAPRVAFILGPLGFTLLCAGAFGYFFRVLPLFKELLQNSEASVSVTISYKWVTFVLLGTLALCWLSCIVLFASLQSILSKGSKKSEAEPLEAQTHPVN